MKLMRPVRCSAIIQPGEYLIARWDGKPCTETNPSHLITCDGCGFTFCLEHHWGLHLDGVTDNHFEAATSS